MAVTTVKLAIMRKQFVWSAKPDTMWSTDYVQVRVA